MNRINFPLWNYVAWQERGEVLIEAPLGNFMSLMLHDNIVIEDTKQFCWMKPQSFTHSSCVSVFLPRLGVIPQSNRTAHCPEHSTVLYPTQYTAVKVSCIDRSGFPPSLKESHTVRRATVRVRCVSWKLIPDNITRTRPKFWRSFFTIH